MQRAKLRMIVSGMVAGDPFQGGASWAVLQYVLGLRGLGHEAYLIEPLALASLRPPGAALADSQNAAYFREAVSQFGLENVSALLLEGTTETIGLSYPDLQKIARNADALLNISGMLQRPDVVSEIPVRIYLDLDPAFNQLWHATQGIDMHLAMHNRFVTVGNALGSPDCSIPTCGVPWITTFQPVVLEYCPVGNGISYDGLTTIANWRGYGSIQHNGVFYGQKAHSLRTMIDLPTKSSEKFMLALAIHAEEQKDLDALARHGWKLLDPVQVAETPLRYRDFIRGSKAEFGIAKSGYVAARCGWFSDRSACYLACGRPVIAQETGFSAFLPCGAGLFSFTMQEEALDAIERINSNYAQHSQAARAIAEEYFDSAKVLSKLIDGVGLA